MCGIIAAIGACKQCECFDLIVGGLKQLQNRGYDSAGICTINPEQGQFVISKLASSETNNHDAVHVLEEHHKSGHLLANVGLGHTRWATHGAKTNVNAHPHTDTQSNSVCLVHNGIIENYQELKTDLMACGVTFATQTDTEVIVNLISHFLVRDEPDCYRSAIVRATKKLSGTYALVIMFKDDPNRLYCVRKGSPLLLGVTDTFALVTSEPAGFNGKVKSYNVIDPDMVCVIEMTRNGVKIDAPPMKTIDIETDYSADMGQHAHWTLKEINEQVESVYRALSNGGRLIPQKHWVKLGGLESHVQKLGKIEHLILLGCGTSYHAGLIATSYFKKLCNFKTVQIFDGAEFTADDFPHIRSDTSGETIGCILLSQSGETQDLYRCIKIARESRAQLIGVVNVVDSLIAREVDCGVYLNAGREVAVASTKAFTSQLTVLGLIACWFSQVHAKKSFNNILEYHAADVAKQVIQETVHKTMDRATAIKEFTVLQKAVQETITLSERALTDEILSYFDNFLSCFIIGKGTGEGIAREAALKIKEIAYIHAEGYSASSLKHGPFALLQKDFPVIIVALDNEYFEKCMNALQEIRSRGARIILITNRRLQHKLDADVALIQLPTETQMIGDILSIIPLQLLAYKLALRRGNNPDYPRNLAKVVTVE